MMLNYTSLTTYLACFTCGFLYLLASNGSRLKMLGYTAEAIGFLARTGGILVGGIFLVQTTCWLWAGVRWLWRLVF